MMPALIQLLEETVNTDLDALQKLSLKLVIRVVIDLTSVLLLLRLVYLPNYKKRELFFTFTVFNIVIFLICFLLNKVELSMGAAFGLFAVFSMLRYRTEEISIKDMTYLFLVIAIGLINAVTKIKDASDTYEYLLLAIINVGILLLTFLMESRLLFKRENSKIINYEKIDLMHADSKDLLLGDLKKRTGLNIQRVAVLKIDFVNDTAQLKIYYLEER